MKTSIGTLIRNSRETRKLTRPQAAKLLGISPGYLGHLECDRPVHLSDALTAKLVKKLYLSANVLGRLRGAQAKRSVKWYAKHRAKAIRIQALERKRKAKKTAHKVSVIRRRKAVDTASKAN